MLVSRWIGIVWISAAACLPRAVAAHGATDQYLVPVFEERCGVCHGTVGVGRAPSRQMLNEFPAERVFTAITTGPMVEHASGLSEDEKRRLAEYATGKLLGDAADRSARSMANQCPPGTPMDDPDSGASWRGMSPDPTTSARFQTTAAAGLRAGQLQGLRLKWAFGMPEARGVRGQPTVAGGRVFIGSDNGMVYAIGARTGCVHWSFEARGAVTTAVSAGRIPGTKDRHAVYFGDFQGRIYAVDANTGQLLWQVAADDSPLAKITGSPVLDPKAERLYVPVGSMEEAYIGSLPKYECCKFQGKVVALDAKNGKQIWKAFTIRERPRPAGKDASGKQIFGPAGSAVWVAPTLDYKRGLLYVGTSNAYNDVPDGESSDAVIAFDLETGERRWSTQLLANDFDDAEDFNANDDVSGSPVLATLADGRQLIIVGQELGRTTALDPDNDGAIVWVSNAAGNRFAPQGGGFGNATDGELYYRPQGICVPAGDDRPGVLYHCQRGYAEAGLMVALRAGTGELAWSTLHPRPTDCPDPAAEACSSGLFGAATAIPGAVLTGSRDGFLRAYATGSGKVLWEYDTKREYQTVNGVPARGGSMGGHGPAIVDGMVFMGSGYSILTHGGHGNVLLAFGIE